LRTEGDAWGKPAPGVPGWWAGTAATAATGTVAGTAAGAGTGGG